MQLIDKEYAVKLDGIVEQLLTDVQFGKVQEPTLVKGTNYFILGENLPTNERTIIMASHASDDPMLLLKLNYDPDQKFLNVDYARQNIPPAVLRLEAPSEALRLDTIAYRLNYQVFNTNNDVERLTFRDMSDISLVDKPDYWVHAVKTADKGGLLIHGYKQKFGNKNAKGEIVKEERWSIESAPVIHFADYFSTTIVHGAHSNIKVFDRSMGGDSLMVLNGNAGFYVDSLATNQTSFTDREYGRLIDLAKKRPIVGQASQANNVM